MRDRLKNIANERILSDEKSEILIEYLSYNMMKLIKEKSDVFGDSSKRNIELRPAVVEIVDRLIEQGELQPTYFEEVQRMGESLRKKYADAREIVSNNKNCFKFESEINEMIDEATEKIDNGTEYNGWIADHTAEELVDSMR
jgi:polyhydroxyalkanoate synthesis regulator phasin